MTEATILKTGRAPNTDNPNFPKSTVVLNLPKDFVPYGPRDFLRHVSGEDSAKMTWMDVKGKIFPVPLYSRPMLRPTSVPPSTQNLPALAYNHDMARVRGMGRCNDH